MTVMLVLKESLKRFIFLSIGYSITIFTKLFSPLVIKSSNSTLRNVFSFIFFAQGKFFSKGEKTQLALLSLKKSRDIANCSIDNNLIVFIAFYGKSYSCSPKAIYENMINDARFKNFKFKWLFKEPEKYAYLTKEPRTTVGIYGHWRGLQYFREAKYIVLNFKTRLEHIKLPEQVLLQCWHGTPLKKLGLDIKTPMKGARSEVDEMYFTYVVEGKKIDYFLSPSKYATEKFISSFGLNVDGNKIIEEGYPRNDYLKTYPKKDITKIKNKLNIPNSKKVILYAPTWRDDQHKVGRGFQFKLNVNLDFLCKHLSKNYVLLLRTHQLVSNELQLSAYSDFVYDVTDVDDINELYIISDILVTDYSSVFFDFANLRRPIVFYMPDFDNYKNNLRDFYLPIEALPGEITKTESELVNALENLKKNKDNIQSRLIEFNKDFNYLDDGNAAKRVIEKVFFQ
jgi:CDP-glycerol glycerophosphotransferase